LSLIPIICTNRKPRRTETHRLKTQDYKATSDVRYL